MKIKLPVILAFISVGMAVVSLSDSQEFLKKTIGSIDIPNITSGIKNLGDSIKTRALKQ